MGRDREGVENKSKFYVFLCFMYLLACVYSITKFWGPQKLICYSEILLY